MKWDMRFAKGPLVLQVRKGSFLSIMKQYASDSVLPVPILTHIQEKIDECIP